MKLFYEKSSELFKKTIILLFIVNYDDSLKNQKAGKNRTLALVNWLKSD